MASEAAKRLMVSLWVGRLLAPNRFGGLWQLLERVVRRTGPPGGGNGIIVFCRDILKEKREEAFALSGSQQV
jgi:hypothetical protein